MDLRALMFVAPVVLSSAEPEPTGTHLDLVAGRALTLSAPATDETPTLTHAVLPPEEDADLDGELAPRSAGGQDRFELDEVEWTVGRAAPLRDIAGAWGMRTKLLRELNPGVRGAQPVPEGTRLVVFRAKGHKPSRSIGAPNRGYLRTGTAMPEGDHWTLRPRRGASFGSLHSIEGLLTALHEYGDRFPDGPRVRLGDLSRRSGRKLSPHVSHRTGRDVDIGYILDPAKRGPRFWQSADEKNLDVKKTWFFIKALVETDRVSSIFVSAKLQRLLIKEARKDLTREQLAHYFRRANPDPNSHSVIRHWKGHRDHMHVRFKCADYERLCIAQSIQK